MQTAEWKFEYSAFEYYKQQKHRGYMVIEEKKANICHNTLEDANTVLHGQNYTRWPKLLLHTLCYILKMSVVVLNDKFTA